MFAWIEGSPRKNAQAFSCDDVAGVEKWKTDQALKSRLALAQPQRLIGRRHSSGTHDF